MIQWKVVELKAGAVIQESGTCDAIAYISI